MRSLRILRSVARSIDKFNNKICDMMEQSEDMIQNKELLEYKLVCLGVSSEKIKDAGEIQERGFIRTEEREKLHRERAQKRKREQEEVEMKEREAKKQKVIPVDEYGNRRKSYEQAEQKDDDDDDGGDVDDDFRDKRAKQQQDLLKSQEKIMHRQDRELEQKEKRIRELQRMLAKEKSKKQTEELIEIPDDDDNGNEDDDEEFNLSKVKTEPKVEPSGSRSGGYKLERENPALLKWLPGFTEKAHEIQPPTPVSEQKTRIYIPQQQEDKSIVLMEHIPIKSTERRSGKTQPVPKGRHKKNKFYCEKCKSEFSRKDSLTSHIKWDCLQEIRQFICEECHAAFFSDTSVREHYYLTHLKTDLYFCPKCGQGFAHKSRKSAHRKSGACPNKDDEDQFPGRAPVDEKLEATFKHRVKMPVEITEAQVQDPNAPQQLEEEDKQQQQQPVGVEGLLAGDPSETPFATATSEDLSAVANILEPLSEGKIPSDLLEEQDQE